MNRKIAWRSGEFSAIGRVYDKVDGKQNEKLLEQLEVLALSEAKNNCGLLTTDGGGILPLNSLTD